MRNDFRRRHLAHQRTKTVCAEHRELFDATDGGRDVRARHSTAVVAVDRLLTLQHGWIEDRRAATEQRRRARAAIREAMTAIAAVGRSMPLPSTLALTLQRPGPMSDGVLIACARDLLARIAPHAGAFAAAGLPSVMLTILEDAIPRAEAAIAAQASSRQRFTAASDSVRERLADADTAARVLAVIARHTPGAPPEALIKLRIAKRVGSRATRTAQAHAVDYVPTVAATMVAAAQPMPHPDRDERSAADGRPDAGPRPDPMPAMPPAAAAGVDRAPETGDAVQFAQVPNAARDVQRLRAVWSRARGPRERTGDDRVILPLRRYG